MRRRAAAALVLLAAGGCAQQFAASTPPSAPAALPVAAYKDVTRGIGHPAPLIAAPLEAGPLVWAFATGECGAERWGEAIDTEAFARANVAAFERSGRDFVVSTGGEAGIFTCDSDAAMERFVRRYLSPRLAGLDFDIEGRQTPAQIRDLAARARFVQQRWPRLRLSFTLATHAGSDAAQRSLNATGETVLAALREAGVLERAVINLMVMNYGPAEAAWCVPRTGGDGCDMARSALQAAHNLHRRHGVPYAHIALTLMLGENDVAGNVTHVDDAASVARDARALGLAGLYFWSLDRDQPCAAGEPRVSPRCHSLPGVPAGAFARVLQGR